MIHDAIVVGAGLSGLVCARRLRAAGAGVIVIEARDRVGGRLHTGRLGDGIIDLGGQWISSGQPRVVALAAELGIATQRHDRLGKVRLDEGERGVFAQLVAAIATWRAVRRIRRTIGDLPTTDTSLLDTTTLDAWLARTIRNRVARDRIAMHAELVFAAAPADLSLLAYLAHLGATDGFAPPGPELPGGGREHRVASGAQSLALALAEELGDAVHLGEPILAIDDTGDRVTARSAAGTHVARRLVLALPPALARSITVDLGPAARSLAAASRMGPVVKCFASYEHAFWRDAGWSGEAYRPRGTVRATVAIETGGAPTLLAFVVGSAAVGWASREPSARRAEIVATLVEHFGPAAGSPLDYVDVDWGADPWSAGCVAGVGPGVLGASARWREPHGRIHLAGTESATAWPGYMEGAIEAGDRAADEVLAPLHR